MAWNQPGDDKRRPAPRSAPDNASLEDMLRRWQQRVQHLWRPGSSRGKAALALVALAVAVWLASGYYQIGAAERGIVQRFGRYVSTEQPGNGWHWPWPIETMTKINVTNLDALDGKGMVLTADQSLINIGWSVQYRIGDPLQYLFNLRDPDSTLRGAGETAIRELAARDTLQSLLSGDARGRLSGEARDRIQQALNRYAAGINITSVSLTDVALPDPVLAAQREAERAAEDSQHAFNDAQAYASQIDLKAQDVAQHQLTDAEVYTTQTVATAQGDAERFTQLASAYALSPQVTRDRLYIDTVGSILAHSRKIFIDARSGNGTVIYLPLDKLAEAMRSTSSTTPTPPPPNTASPVEASNGAEATPSDRQSDDARGRERVDR